MPRWLLPLLATSLGACVTPAVREAYVPREPPPCWGASVNGCLQTAHLRSAMRVDPPPPFVSSHFGARPFATYAIDLDSDGKDDFIAEEVVSTYAPGESCFFDSGGSVRHCGKGSYLGAYDGFAYLWFAQLDDDPTLELFSMEGDSCSSDYTLQKLDPQTWERKKVARISPLLTTGSDDPRQTFWGYPWDIRELAVEGARMLAAAPAMLCSVESDDEPPGVAVFFIGVPTQGAPSDLFLRALKARRPMTLAEVIGLSTGSPACAARPADTH